MSKRSRKNTRMELGEVKGDPSVQPNDQQVRIAKQQQFSAWFEEAIDTFHEENARSTHEIQFGDATVEEERVLLPR